MVQTQTHNTYSDQELDKRREFDRSRPLERDETSNLISSDKVSGTSVYSSNGEYAVMSFGGFLGIGEQLHPLPWDSLDYDTDRDGYVIDKTKDELEKAPTFDRDRDPEWNRSYGENVYAYYGVMY